MQKRKADDISKDHNINPHDPLNAPTPMDPQIPLIPSCKKTKFLRSRSLVSISTCKKIRHECYEQLELLLTRNHMSQPGIVDIIADYWYIASSELLDLYAKDTITSEQRMTGPKECDVSAFMQFGSLYGNQLYQIKDKIKWIPIPDLLKQRHDTNMKRFKAMVKGNQDVYQARKSLYVIQQRGDKHKKSERERSDDTEDSKNVQDNTNVEDRPQGSWTVDKRLDLAEEILLSRQKELLNVESQINDPDDDDDLLKGAYHSNSFWAAIDVELNPYRIENVLKMCPLNGCTIGEFLAHFISEYHRQYHTVHNLIHEQAAVGEFFNGYKNSSSRNYLDALQNPDAMLGILNLILNGSYQNGDIFRTSDYRDQGIHVILVDKHGIMRVHDGGGEANMS